MATAEQWLGKLAPLKVDKARGDPAPHKPLLLLVVLELAEQGQAFGDILALTPELAFPFERSIVLDHTLRGFHLITVMRCAFPNLADSYVFPGSRAAEACQRWTYDTRSGREIFIARANLRSMEMRGSLVF